MAGDGPNGDLEFFRRADWSYGYAAYVNPKAREFALKQSLRLNDSKDQLLTLQVCGKICVLAAFLGHLRT